MNPLDCPGSGRAPYKLDWPAFGEVWADTGSLDIEVATGVHSIIVDRHNGKERQLCEC